MARSKQKRTPASSRSATMGTPSVAVSPIFSNKTSVQPTPDTSDIEGDMPKSVDRPKRVTRASSSNLTKKRAARSEDDQDNNDPVDLPKKRRVLSRTVYVDIPTMKGARTKAQPKVRIIYYPARQHRIDYFLRRLCHLLRTKAKAGDNP